MKLHPSIFQPQNLSGLDRQSHLPLRRAMLRHRRPLQYKKRGFTPSETAFTVLEMLAAMAILMIVSGILFYALNNVSRAVSNAVGKTDSYQASRVILDKMSRELQQAIPLVAVVGVTTNEIFTATANELHFVAVIDNNHGHEEAEVHYFYDGSDKLYQNIGFYDGPSSTTWDFDSNLGWATTPPVGAAAPYQLILTGVSQFSFEFWANSDPTTTPTSASWTGYKYQIPAYARVTLKVYDQSLIKRWGTANLVPPLFADQVRTFKIMAHIPRFAE